MSNLAIVQGGGNLERVQPSEELNLLNKLLEAREQIGYYKGILNANGIFMPTLQKTPSVRMSIYKAEGGTR